MSDMVYDVVIIGGGPAGLSAAQYSARSNLKTIVLDKSSTAGALAYTNRIENYPGVVEPLTGKELLDLFRRQAIAFGAEYAEQQRSRVPPVEARTLVVENPGIAGLPLQEVSGLAESGVTVSRHRRAGTSAVRNADP